MKVLGADMTVGWPLLVQLAGEVNSEGEQQKEQQTANSDSRPAEQKGAVTPVNCPRSLTAHCYCLLHTAFTACLCPSLFRLRHYPAPWPEVLLALLVWQHLEPAALVAVGPSPGYLLVLPAAAAGPDYRLVLPAVAAGPDYRLVLPAVAVGPWAAPAAELAAGRESPSAEFERLSFPAA